MLIAIALAYTKMIGRAVMDAYIAAAAGIFSINDSVSK
jgi:hypothetical protein